MKILLCLTLLFSFNAFSEQGDESCELPNTQPILDDETAQLVGNLNDAIKKDFKRRPLTTSGFVLALNIETNFEVPLIGSDVYWGRIYLKNGDDKNIAYRDDLLAEKNYDREKADPKRFTYSNYSVANINSAQGLSLAKAAGAEVNVKSTDGNFTTKAGGRLTIKVKAPGENSTTLIIDVVNSGGKISKFLIVGNSRVSFDSFKINAEKNIFGSTSILSGVETIEFFSGGKVTHTITQ